MMDRRKLLKSAAAVAVTAAGGIPAPAISQRVAARALRFVPQADLANFDPIWNTQYVVRNAAALVWDMLYGVDAKLQPRRQMVESEEVSADGLTWTFRLRPGLKFHDGERVLAKDIVAKMPPYQTPHTASTAAAIRPARGPAIRRAVAAVAPMPATPVNALSTCRIV